MTIQTINLGTYANDGTGDDLRVAFQKVNANIAELYSTVFGANVGANPPISGVEEGELWWSTVEGRLYIKYGTSWVDASPEDGFVTYDITAETATGGASVRLNGTDLSQDSIKFASSTNVTVTRTDANTITFSSESFIGNVTGNLLGNVVGNVVGNTNGLHTGAVIGNVTGDVFGDTDGLHTGSVIGDVTGDVTGDTTGTHTGAVIGNVTGNTTGTHTGAVVGNVTGDTTGTHTGAVVGNVTGNTTGTHTGAVVGNVVGDVTGTHTGAVVGDVVGDVTGDIYDGAVKIFDNQTRATKIDIITDAGNIVLAHNSVNLYNSSGTLLISGGSSQFIGSLTGNASTVTNGVYTDGSYADPTWITSLAGSKVSGNISGNAGTVTNGVYTTGDQTIGGTKTFSNKITGSISGNADGNAGTVTNGVYTTGDQTIGGTKTFSNTITGNVSGNAGTVTNGVYTSSSVNALSDVDTVSVAPTDGQTLVWNSGVSQWKPGTIAPGGVTKIIAGTNISINPTNGLGDVTITSTGGAGGSLDFGTFSAPAGFSLDLGTF
jgi:outer membrane lipoprotein SlyB